MIDQWYEQYNSELTRFIRSKGFAPEDADDICAQVFLEAVRAQPSNISPRGWLYAVTKNRMTEVWRQRARRKLVPLMDMPVEMPELCDPLPLDCLTKEQRAVIEARYIKDWTIEETSAVLGISPSSVKARQHRAIEALRGEFERRERVTRKSGVIAPHWYGGKVEPPPYPIEEPATLPCPPMPDQLCANGDGRLAYVRIRRRALCAVCGLLWLCPETSDEDAIKRLSSPQPSL